MNKETNESFIYCTPLLDEVTRVRTSCRRDFYEPDNYGHRKIDSFNQLLLDGKDIVVTHCTFANADDDTIEYIRNGNYSLILDETLDILVNFNEATGDSISKNDIRLLIDEDFITVNDYGKVSWAKKSYAGSKYSNIERLAKNGTLFYINQALLVWQFPPEIFRLFKKVYVLTYLFQGSFLKPYFEYHNIKYELAGIKKDSNEQYRLCTWSSDVNHRKRFCNLIKIFDDRRMNDYRNFALSKKWFQNASRSDKLKILRNNVHNYFRNIMKARSNRILWTTYKDYYNHLKGAGYTIVRRMTQDEKHLPKLEREKLEKKLRCFLPCNTRAVNDFQDRDVLAYIVNVYPNPYIVKYFQLKNDLDGTNIEMNQDYFALAAMLQWIFRSAIRTDEPIDIYIPSQRMRDLLVAWLNGKI